MGFAAGTKDKQDFESLQYQYGNEYLPQHICWNDSYSVGDKQLDEHHKQLLVILNKACDACAHGNHRAFPLILNELLDYVIYHFEEEENYMYGIKYPELETHKIEHLQFCNTLKGYQQMMDENNELFSIKLIDLTHTTYLWLCEHILKKDLQFSSASH